MAFCKEPTCKREIFFLFNQETGNTVPVDPDSMLEEEIYRYKTGSDTVYFDKSYHVSHFKTCRKPDNFSQAKKKINGGKNDKT